MKSKFLYIFLGFSLGLNLSLGGAYLSEWVREKRAVHEFLDRPGRGASLPPMLEHKMAVSRKAELPEFRKAWKKIRKARKGLYNALQEDPPDRKKTIEHLDRLARLQKRQQAMIVKRAVLCDMKLLDCIRKNGDEKSRTAASSPTDTP